jgi:8-amino-7-oxononanoate synthase
VLANAERLRDGLEVLGFAVVQPQTLSAEAVVQEHAPGVRRSQDGGRLSIVTPVVPVLVGDDWKAALLWKALYQAGVFVNTALHPAVPPGGAMLRTSVMATHDEATIDRALGIFAQVKRAFESEHGPLPTSRRD